MSGIVAWAKAPRTADRMIQRPGAPLRTLSDFAAAPRDRVGKGEARSCQDRNALAAFAHPTINT
jgi:hypothetical protein